MSDSIKELLAHYEPEPPHLDWKSIWIEQGRAEAQVEQTMIRQRQLRPWKGLSLVSLTVTATLLVVLTVSWSAMNRPHSTPAIDSAARPDSTARPEIALSGQPVEPATGPVPATPMVPQASGSSPEQPSSSWLASWHRVDLRQDVANRQRLLAHGLAGLEAYDSTSRRPAATDSPNRLQENLSYKDLLERYLRFPQTTTSDALRQGDRL